MQIPREGHKRIGPRRSKKTLRDMFVEDFIKYLYLSIYIYIHVRICLYRNLYIGIYTNIVNLYSIIMCYPLWYVQPNIYRIFWVYIDIINHLYSLPFNHLYIHGINSMSTQRFAGCVSYARCWGIATPKSHIHAKTPAKHLQMHALFQIIPQILCMDVSKEKKLPKSTKHD